MSSLPAVFPLTIDVTRRQHIAMSGMKNVLDVIRIVRVVRGAKLMCVTVCVCVGGGAGGRHINTVSLIVSRRPTRCPVPCLVMVISERTAGTAAC